MGRPQATDHDAIALVAMRLFIEKGYGATTMEDIAAAVGLGRTTLWRYFPTKSAILEGNFESRLAEFREALAQQSMGVSILDGAFVAWCDSVSRRSDHLALDKERVRVMVTADPEATRPWAGYNVWGGCLVEYVAKRRGLEATNFDCRVLGMTLWSAIWSAMGCWALSDDEDPLPYYRQAHKLVADLSGYGLGK
jgi:AcrR family transcriptional regulator